MNKLSEMSTDELVAMYHRICAEAEARGKLDDDECRQILLDIGKKIITD